MLLLTVHEGLHELDPGGAYAFVSLIVFGQDGGVTEQEVIE